MDEARTEYTSVRPGLAVIAVTAVVVVTLTWAIGSHFGWAPRTAPASQVSSGQANQHGLSAQLGAGIDPEQAPSSGPVSELDKDLLIKVRQADLWELPAGRLAQGNSSSEPVRRAGVHLMEGHSRLDQIVREIAKQLNIAIPNEPSAQQQEWLQTLRTTRGAEFDRFFANQLRIAHGKVFVAIAKVRSTTKNSVIRDLAIEANNAVADHMEVLEDTGLVVDSTFDDVAADVTK